MTFDNQVSSMNPGQALMEVPIPKLIENTAKAIASAQYELDSSAVRAATLLSETRIGFKGADGVTEERSLLELGFTPSFYHFTETEMEFHVTISVKVESGIDFGISGNVRGGNAQSVAFGATLSLDIHHKYGFEMEAASTIRTKMKAVPPPQVFISALQVHAGQGGTLVAPEGSEAGGENGGTTPAGGGESGGGGADTGGGDAGGGDSGGGDAGDSN
jgi:hypothetical protein